MREGSLPAAPLSRGARRATGIVLAIGGFLLVLMAAGVILAVLGARSIGWSPGARTVHVLGMAMAPTVIDGDYLLAQPYSTSSPRQGEIIVMYDPYDRARYFVERVVAGPGQTVLIRNAQVIVDGTPLSEPYVASGPWTIGADWPSNGHAVTLASDDYFVLGDNRNHSSDSRTFGPVRRQDIWGRAARILLPTQRARAL
jgi:signal peptidase I